MDYGERIENALRYIRLYTGCDDIALKRIGAMLDTSGAYSTDTKIVETTKVVYVKGNKHITLPFKDWANDYLYNNNLTYKELAKKKRTADILRVRNKFCIEAYSSGYTLVEIGRYLGKDHSTIINSIKQLKSKKNANIETTDITTD